MVTTHGVLVAGSRPPLGSVVESVYSAWSVIELIPGTESNIADVRRVGKGFEWDLGMDLIVACQHGHEMKRSRKVLPRDPYQMEQINPAAVRETM